MTKKPRPPKPVDATERTTNDLLSLSDSAYFEWVMAVRARIGALERQIWSLEGREKNITRKRREFSS